ncbi:telokin-like protein [Adoxophyes orana nucleopolyhedrovirus]|uniref:telokin-like protein n=1 Tax=Adoxophyes orana nucleopolyhedrovirus TaxID=542343 RepID=UPI0001829C0D|nr:telokin-like protein [Adoxophyes orana nucleopolyhedrovirus]ACF05354.1 telokin-like protein [Adoxophyes orana nucleopolyhedrovirus]
MAHNSSGAIAYISVSVMLTRKKNENVLSFTVNDETHLKQLTCGAYHLKIVETPLLDPLINSYHYYAPQVFGDYTVIYNVDANSRQVKMILFNITSTVFKRDSVIFQIVYPNYKMLTDSKSPIDYYDAPFFLQQQGSSGERHDSSSPSPAASSAGNGDDDNDDNDNASNGSHDESISCASKPKIKKRNHSQSDKI